MKYRYGIAVLAEIASPSPRRAWIEIAPFYRPEMGLYVALPTEGVD